MKKKIKERMWNEQKSFKDTNELENDSIYKHRKVIYIEFKIKIWNR